MYSYKYTRNCSCNPPEKRAQFSLLDALQGFAVAGATGLALVPYFMGLLGLSFEEACSIVCLYLFHGYSLATRMRQDG